MKKFTLIRSIVVLIVSLFMSLFFAFASITDITDVRTFANTLIPGETTNLAVEYTKEMDDPEIEAAMNKNAKLVAKQTEPTGEESPEENFTYEEYGSNGLKITGYTGVESKVVIPATIDKTIIKVNAIVTALNKLLLPDAFAP